MKILYVTTTGSTMGFFCVFVRSLLDEGYAIDIACDEKQAPVPGCYSEWGCTVYPLSCTRAPFDRGNLQAIKELRKIVMSGHYDIVYCHTPIAAMCTRFACKQLRKNGLRVLYMAHGFHFWKGAPLKNWLLYYPVEWLCARWTDVLITINREDYDLAKKHMHAKRVEYIPGIGIDTKRFAPDVLTSEEKAALRGTLGLKAGEKMLLSVGELSARKNHEVVIRALSELHDPSIKYYICGEGPLRKKLSGLIEKKGLADSVFLLGFRRDIPALCGCADLFVLPSLQEGVSVALMEAIASRMPTICSNIRGNNDIMPESAMFSPYDVQGTAEKIREYLSGDKSKEIARNYAVLQEYDLQKVMLLMRDIILSVQIEENEK